jgi:hypothetical protein
MTQYRQKRAPTSAPVDAARYTREELQADEAMWGMLERYGHTVNVSDVVYLVHYAGSETIVVWDEAGFLERYEPVEVGS